MKIGVIGCGKISSAYLGGCKLFPVLEMHRVADLLPERAAEQARNFEVPHSGTVEELLADPEVELVINLTIPAAHAEINRAVIEAGKHLFCEKPFVPSREEAMALLELAKSKGLRVGSAPDTFLGEGHQTCRTVVDEGALGEVVAGTAFFACHGHEHWHPNPAFYYEPGGGPMFDMGPYYLTALVNLIGPMRRVSGMAKTTFAERIATAKEIAGRKIEVKTPTHFSGSIEFVNGAIVTVIMSFDVWGQTLPRLEVHGTLSSLQVPDPNGAGGIPKLYQPQTKDWADIPLAIPVVYDGKYARGAGVADMAEAIDQGRPHRANGEVALHVVDAMQAFQEASVAGASVTLQTTCARPEAVAPGAD